MASQFRAAASRHATLAAGAVVMVSVPAATTLLEDFVPPPSFPWRHTGFTNSYDCSALRRGFQVYREVCATCHSLEFIRWRELVNVTHTRDEIKEMAKNTEVLDGPNEEGEMFERPAKLYDKLPAPYANEKQAQAANNGAIPPDLTLMVKARPAGLHYIMALLTGYMDPPAGKVLMQGLHYNPYFPGGGIAMPPPLQDEGVEYEDGTVATVSQQARDCAQFLHWTAEPELDLRNKNGVLVVASLIFVTLLTGYKKRVYWSFLKTNRVKYVKGT